MEAVIKKIIKESVNAPSGDNCQPWYFSVRDSQLFIYKKDEGNNNFLDFKNRGTFLAHGALIENISIAALHYSYKLAIKLFPGEKDCIAVIDFLEDKSSKNTINENLYCALCNRSTNRKAYQDKVISQEIKNHLSEITNPIGDIVFIEDSEEKRKLFTTTTQMERIALQNKFFHKFFFDSIVWSQEEEQKKKSGLYLKTMELPIPVQMFFKILKYWPIAKLLSKIGFSKKVADSNAEMYQTSSAIIFSIKETSPESFITIGRVIERFWLTTTYLGIATHPLAGVLYIYQRILEDAGVFDKLTNEEILYVKEGYEHIQNNLLKNKNTIAMILRIGYSEAPSAISSKRSPEFI